MSKFDKGMESTNIEKHSLLARIDKGIAKDEIPESIKPENMMERIKQLKSEGYFEERENKLSEGEVQYAKLQKLRKIRKTGIAVACVALFCVVMFVPFGEFGYKDNPYGSYQSIADSVKTQDDKGNNVLAGYKELSQYMIANTSLKVKPDEVVESLFEKLISISPDGTSSIKGQSTQDWDSLSGDSNFVENQYNSSEEYSDTNVRTEGVAEADTVKTDGKYIYYIDDDFGRIQLVIAKADGENTCIVGKTEVNRELFEEFSVYYGDDTTRFYTSELFVYKDTVIIIMSGAISIDKGAHYDEDYRTLVLIYDTKDIAEPKLVSDFTIDGYYESSRMVDGYVYVFTCENIDKDLDSKLYTEEEAAVLLAPKVDGEVIEADNIYVAGNDKFSSYKIIATLDVDDTSELKSVKAILGDGYGLTSYVSNEHIYFISRINNQYTEDIEVTEDEVLVTDHIEILKFDYTCGEVNLVDKALVSGTLGDEFDIDEHNGYLRIAVTVNELLYCVVEKKYTFFDGEGWYDFNSIDYDTYNIDNKCSKLFVLDDELEIVGDVTLQLDESVYGVRFDGDVAYVVTFRQTDPLFSVDLSEPTEPRIMGKLKIPGFSTYLHKWDENTLMGIGYMSTMGNQVKVSIYDISDKYDIVETGEFKLPSNGHSSAPYNHKEIFISPEKNLIGMWMLGNFIQDDRVGSAVYVVYSYVDGQLQQVIKCMLSEEESIEGTRCMYIGDYIYIVSLENGVYVYSMDDYAQLVHAE